MTNGVCDPYSKASKLQRQRTFLKKTSGNKFYFTLKLATPI